MTRVIGRYAGRSWRHSVLHAARWRRGHLTIGSVYRAVIAGGVLINAGQLRFAADLPTFFAGLILLACGTGLLKPNVSTIVGNLYADRPELRDAGFNIFYMGINIGSFIAPIVVSYLRHAFGWRVAFASAAVGVLLALSVFVCFRRHLGAAGNWAEWRSRIPTSAAGGADRAAGRSESSSLRFLHQNGFTSRSGRTTRLRLAPKRFSRSTRSDHPVLAAARRALAALPARREPPLSQRSIGMGASVPRSRRWRCRLRRHLGRVGCRLIAATS